MGMNTIVMLENSDGTSGLDEKLKGTGGAAHVYGLARKATTGPQTAGSYSTTEILGFNVLNVGSSGNWVLTYVDGGVSTIAFGDMREGYFHAHLSAITVPTGGIAELFIP